MRFLLRFVGERITEDRGEDSSVAEGTLIVAIEGRIDRLLRRADDELAKGIPVFCRLLNRFKVKPVLEAGRLPIS